MYYSIRHLTKFLYSNPVSESMMETRMHPRSDQNQRCLTFHLSVSPRCRVFSYRDHLANQVHHFDIPGQHGQLVIVAESLVEVAPAPQIPAFLAPDAWAELDSMIEKGDYWEMLFPSEFAAPTPALDALANELDVQRRDDPLMVLHQLNEQIYKYFDYKPKSTKVDSPIDLALSTHTGVCQDFAHIMITLVRTKLRIPCRYVSGYLFHGQSDHLDRGAAAAAGLGGLRSDQLAGGWRPPHSHRDRPRLCRCAADPWHLPRSRQQRVDGCGAGHAQRRHAVARPGAAGARRLVDPGGEGHGPAGTASAADAPAADGAAAIALRLRTIDEGSKQCRRGMPNPSRSPRCTGGRSPSTRARRFGVRGRLTNRQWRMR